MARLLLFLVLGGYIMYGITNMSLNKSVTNATENSVTSFSYNQAKNIAHSTIQMILSKLGDNLNWRVTTPKTIDLYGGYVTYTVTSTSETSGDDDDGGGGGGTGDDDDDNNGDDDDDDHNGDDDDDDHNGDDDDDDHNGDDDDDDHNGDDDDDDHNGDDDDDHHGGGHHGKGDHGQLLRLGYGDDYAAMFDSYLQLTSGESTEDADVNQVALASVFNVISESAFEYNFNVSGDDDDDDDDHNGDDDDDDDHNGDDDDDDHNGDDDDDDHNGDDDDDDHNGDDDDDDHNGDDDDDDHNGDDDDDNNSGDDDDGGGTLNDSDLYQTIKIAVTAYYNGVMKSVVVVAKGRDFTQVKLPVTVKAAVTTNIPVNTLGTLVIDGRDHSLSGTLKSGKGKLGVWTTEQITQSGASKIGGTYGSTDYAPSDPADPDVISENQQYSNYPDTPEEVLGGSSAGYTEGLLKKVAQLGVKGSQYVTDPSQLTYPLKGVTYVELPDGQVWNSAKVEGEGILVVHNSNKTAVIKNIRAHYNFTGLIIADDIIHIHNQILGAVVVLTDNPSEGNTIGNGTGKVLYSSDALKDIIAEAERITKTNYGFGKPRLKVLHWYEKNYQYAVKFY